MKKLFVVLIAISLMASFAYAGDEMTPAAKAGATSLNFTFGGLGTFNFGCAGLIYPIQTTASTISVPYGMSVSFFTGNSSALRIGLQVQNQSMTIPSNLTNGTDGSQSQFAAGISLDYVGYMGSINNRVRPYLGLGVLFDYSTNDYKPAVASGVTQPETKNSFTNPAGIAAGIRGIAGAEFFIYNEISVSAEYQLNLFGIESFADTKSTFGTITTTTKNGSGTQILGFGALGATVHIYF
jgi:opacity protein-like surface antigen